MTALRAGFTLAITVAVFYTACALIWAFAPQASLTWMNSLFHGLDFSGMVRPRAFAWSGFLYALAVLAVWGFALGAFYNWLATRLAA
jgi:hypothetical protein